MKFERAMLSAIFLLLTGIFICIFITINTGNAIFVTGSFIALLGVFIGILSLLFIKKDN